jgi:hypothetical protein
MAGGSVNLVQSKSFEIGYNVNSVFDVKGTILDSNIFKNTVSTFDWKIKKEISGNLISIGGEAGTSKHYFSADTLAPNLSDYFVNAFAKYYITKWRLTFTAGYLNVGPDFRSIGAQSKDVNYNGLPTFFNRYTNAQDIRPITLFDVIGNENIYNRTVTQNMMPISTVFNNVLPFGIATNNRIGGYARVQFKTKNEIALNAEYFNLNEIRGQGSFALKKFEVYKAYVLVPINKLIKHTKHISIQFGTTIQNTKRNSSESIENIKLESMQINGGFRWEIFKNFDLLGGYISQNTKGNEFSADRNTYNQITYFNIANYNLNQQIIAGGIRYNFGVNTHLTLLYQSNKYQDKLGNNASFEIKQFGIIYSITL